MNIRAYVIPFVLLVSGLGAVHTVDACTNALQCGIGADSCSAICAEGSTCIAVCFCNEDEDALCSCICFTFSLLDYIDTPGTVPINRANSLRISFPDPINLKALAFGVNNLGGNTEDAGWGVIIDGDEGLSVDADSYAGTFTSVIEAIGLDNGFSVSWNDTTHVVTFTED